MKECSVKTKTKSTISGVLLIHSFADLLNDGTKSPEIFDSDILEEKSFVNNVKGEQGEGILSSALEIKSRIISGEFIVETEDDPEDYFINIHNELCYCKFFENDTIDGGASTDDDYDGIIDGGELINEFESSNNIDCGNAFTEIEI